MPGYPWTISNIGSLFPRSTCARSSSISFFILCTKVSSNRYCSLFGACSRAQMSLSTVSRVPLLALSCQVTCGICSAYLLRLTCRFFFRSSRCFFPESGICAHGLVSLTVSPVIGGVCHRCSPISCAFAYSRCRIVFACVLRKVFVSECSPSSDNLPQLKMFLKSASERLKGWISSSASVSSFSSLASVSFSYWVPAMVCTSIFSMNFFAFSETTCPEM